MVAAMADEPDVVACRFAPLHLLFPHAALLVCHGGQLTVFEALSHRVPVLVMPFQAEQAHNGICLERIRCGRRLTPSLHFLGHPGVYVEAFQATTDQALQGIVRSVREDACTTDGLAAAQATLSECGGLKSLTSALVGH